MPSDWVAQLAIFALERPDVLGTVALYIVDLLTRMVVDTLMFGAIVVYVWWKLPEETRCEIVAIAAKTLPKKLSAYLFDGNEPKDPP